VEQDWIDRIVERLSDLQPDLDVEAYQVTGRIARIATRVAQREEMIFARFGLNRGDVGVLSALQTSAPPHTLSPTQLFQGLMMSSAGMTKRLDQLEARGLIKRKPDPKDGRGVLVQLTSTGSRLIRKAIAENTKAESKVIAQFTGNERRLFGDLLRLLLRQLELAHGEQDASLTPTR
jgi:DNA-binding MarR family transcriptional regulator